MSPPNLLNITLDDVADGFDTGQYTSQDLVKAYTERIAEVNHQFKAVLQVNPDALSIAYSLDQERKVQGTVRSPLHGVPILVKDNIWTNDKTDSSAGSYVLLGARCKHESTVSRKLREAGAIILGKTNQTEWSNWRTLDPNNNGWSARGGQCTGPYYKGQDPYGSSSGSGVAGALALAYACIGTEVTAFAFMVVHH
jgi:amidase